LTSLVFELKHIAHENVSFSPFVGIHPGLFVPAAEAGMKTASLSSAGAKSGAHHKARKKHRKSRKAHQKHASKAKRAAKA